MHVAVDATGLQGDWRGITRYVRAVLKRLAGRAGVRVTMVEPSLFGYRLPRDADVVWHPANGTFFDAPIPSVVTFHDAVPFRFAADDERRRSNQQRPWLRSAASGTAFLANSHFTAAEVTEFLGVARARQTVTPFAVEPEVFVPDGPHASLAANKPFVLFVAAAEERKNLATLVAAHARAFPNDDVALVVAGGAPPRGTRATWLGVLDAPALATWYRAATLVAVPSYYEGFGFPLLEAMACGRAVLASRAASLPEVGGDGCAWIDGPLDVRAWADGLQSLMSDERERQRLERAALARAQTFSWDRCAEETLSVFRTAAASR